MLNDVNRAVNALIVTRSEEGQPDEWQAPYLIALEKKGDCEDYARLKLAVLIYIASINPEVELERLSLVLVGKYIKEGIDHMVVFYDASPQKDLSLVFMLDNFSNNLESPTGKSFNTIVYTISKNGEDVRKGTINKTAENKFLVQGPG